MRAPLACITPLLLPALAALPLTGQETADPRPAASMPTPSAPAEGSAPEAAAPPAGLPMEETRIRSGIVMLGMLHDTMAKIRDHDSAEAAVPSLVRLTNELQAWGHSFNNLPPLDEATQSDYEKKYLPVIRQINERIKAQGERLAAAEFYGSQNLPAALVRLVNSLQ